MQDKNKKQAYIIAVDMGYGHQRAVFPLRYIAERPEWDGNMGGIIIANKYAGIPNSDRRKWEGGRKLYEAISLPSSAVCPYRVDMA